MGAGAKSYISITPSPALYRCTVWPLLVVIEFSQGYCMSAERNLNQNSCCLCPPLAPDHVSHVVLRNRVWTSRLRLGSPYWEVVQMYQTHHPVAGPAGLAGEETEVMSLYSP